MQMKMLTTGRGLIALAALVLVGGTGVVWAQKAVPQQKTKPRIFLPLPPRPPSKTIVIASTSDVLKGLQGVEIVVEGLPDGAKKIGLTEDRIQSAVELSLRRNRVPVLTKKEVLAKPGNPSLYVNVTVLGGAFSISIELRENVRLDRDPKTFVYGATTWSKASVGNAGRDATSADYIVKSVERKVDEFCLDYLKANPK